MNNYNTKFLINDPKRQNIIFNEKIQRKSQDTLVFLQVRRKKVQSSRIRLKICRKKKIPTINLVKPHRHGQKG